MTNADRPLHRPSHPRPRIFHLTHLAPRVADRREFPSHHPAILTAAGLGWQWLPRRNGAPPADHEDAAVAAMLDTWIALLAGGASLHIHCAAGIHRTGTLTHALLRRAGHSPADALQLLAALRTPRVGPPLRAFTVTIHGDGDGRTAQVTTSRAAPSS